MYMCKVILAQTYVLLKRNTTVHALLVQAERVLSPDGLEMIDIKITSSAAYTTIYPLLCSPTKHLFRDTAS